MLKIKTFRVLLWIGIITSIGGLIGWSLCITKIDTEEEAKKEIQKEIDGKIVIIKNDLNYLNDSIYHQFSKEFKIFLEGNKNVKKSIGIVESEREDVIIYQDVKTKNRFEILKGIGDKDVNIGDRIEVYYVGNNKEEVISWIGFIKIGI